MFTGCPSEPDSLQVEIREMMVAEKDSQGYTNSNASIHAMTST
jgi:hypothetical protein